MDIITHAASGLVIASPFIERHPFSACLFVFGTCVPDLDVFSRIFGKRAFIFNHQTFTHSISAIFAFPILCWFLLSIYEINEIWASVFFGIGILLHIIMDYTNTYGVAWFAPFSWKRYKLNWIFFIDFVVLAITIIFAIFVAYSIMLSETVSVNIIYVYIGLLIGYWIIMLFFHRQAWKIAPVDTLSLIPSAILPGIYYGYTVSKDVATTFKLNIFNRLQLNKSIVPIFDIQYQAVLNKSSHYLSMRNITDGYHAVEVIREMEIDHIIFRDLCTRNFGGKFGTLELWVDIEGNIIKEVFHV